MAFAVQMRMMECLDVSSRILSLDTHSDRTSRGRGVHQIRASKPIIYLLTLVLAAFVGSSFSAHAHSGGLNAEGCHNNRKTGDYHCHGGGAPKVRKQTAPAPLVGADDVYYPNCAAARRAGAAPVRIGDPGYASHLDRDRDGVGCE